MAGQVLKRDEADNNSAAGDPHEIWYRFAGRQIGYTGNNGTLESDYQVSIDNRQKTVGTGAFRFGTASAAAFADFSQALDPVNSYSQGAGGGSYSVRTGDTLSSIAQQLWGDSALWYKLAEANGLSANAGLVEGQNLTIPAGVSKSTNNASTFRPYDPSDAIGDTSPINPKTPKKNKCGAFGQVLLVAVAVAVSAITYGALTGPATGLLGSIAAGAVSGAAGSAASQGLGVAIGIQDKFSWKGVAMAALAGGIGGGIGASVPGGALNRLSTFGRGAFIGLSTSALSQGIGVVTGLNKKFDFAGVAAAALGGGAGGAVGGRLGNTGTFSLANFGKGLASGMAGGLANAATRSVLSGTSFGDNIMRALPDVIGSTIGNMMAGAASARGESSMARLRREGGVAYAQNLDPNVRSDYEQDIIVEATRRQVERAKHGWGWKLADALGAHKGGFLYDLVHGRNRGSIDTSALAHSISMSVRRAPSATAEFASGLGHGVYNVGANLVTGVYHLVTTNPLATIRSTGHALVSGIDSVLAAEDTPAYMQLRRAGSRLSNASAYDLGYGLGNVGGNVALLVAPELAASRVGMASRVGAAESAGPNLIPRLGPKGVDPLHHNANVLVRDAQGNVVAHQRFVSGNMTLEEQALGFPRNTLASHTEARAVRAMELQPGGRMTITGQSPLPIM